MDNEVELAIIGGGPAGRRAAGYAGRSGAKVALITESVAARPQLDQTAITFLAVQAEHAHLTGREDATPAALRESLAGAMEIGRATRQSEFDELRDLGVELVVGLACIAAPDHLSVNLPDATTQWVGCQSIILAPGVQELIPVDSDRVVTPRSIAALEKVPDAIAILGSDVAALEIARYFAAWEIDVSVVGGRRSVLDFLDADLRDTVTSAAADNGIRVIHDATAVVGTVNGGVDVLLDNGTHLDCEYAFVCGEGKYRTETLGLERCGVRTGVDGEILVDRNMRTNIPEIFAVGAVAGTRCSMNVVRRQAEVAAENALGGDAWINHD